MKKDWRIFVDTGAYSALFHKADQRFQQACNAWSELEKQQRIIYTKNHIIDELATLLARRTEYGFASRKIAHILIFPFNKLLIVS